MQERQRSRSAVRDWTSCRVQVSFHALSVALEWAATASSAMAASAGWTRNAVGSSAWKRTLTTDVHGARELHAPWMADHRRKSRSDLTGGSFLLLPRRHALSSRWLWTFNHNTCENRLEEVQGSATSPLFMPPLFQNTWPCVQLLCAERNAPCQWDLAIDKAEPPVSAAKRQGNVRPQDIVITRSNELLVRLGIEDLDLILKERRLRWYGHVERSKGAVPTAFDIQVDGKRGPGRPKMTWKQLTERDCREWKLSAINFMIDIPGDLVWDLPCVQQASYLEGGPLMWILPLYLHINQKSNYDMMIMTLLPKSEVLLQCKVYSHIFSKNINVLVIFQDRNFDVMLAEDFV